MLRLHLGLFLTVLLPGGAWSQRPLTPPTLPTSPPPIGVTAGLRVGRPTQDTGLLRALPRDSIRGRATYAVELDTFDFRPKWTLRLWFPGPDSLELVLRHGDTLPPKAGSYRLDLLATGRSHNREAVAGGVRAWDGSQWQAFVTGGPQDWVTFGASAPGTMVGVVDLVAARLDYSDPKLRPLGRWRYRGLAVVFTAQRGTSPPPPPMAPADEDRLMVRAIDGLMITWSGAINGDGELRHRTEAGVRDFIAQRWGTTLAVDSIVLHGEELWIRLRGTHLGRRCSQSTSEVAFHCGWAPGARS